VSALALGPALALVVAGILAADVKTGLDVLAAAGFEPLAGKRVGLVTNATGVDRAGRSAIDLIHGAKGVRLVALFSPEHGIRGTEDRAVASGRDERTGLPIHSLYGETKRPTKAMLEGVDVLVFDIQDIGARFYTYATTLAFCLEAAAQHGVAVVVLDRPNPIGGAVVEGPVLEKELRGGFASYLALPTRHGLTLGEIARWHVGEQKLGCALTVVPVEGWRPSAFFDETGLPWVNPSPNMTSLAAAIHYPGLGALEGTNLSVGRGTDAPFQVYGAPWIDDERRLVADLNRRRLPGVRFAAATFTPKPMPGRPRYPYTGERCRGFRAEITDRAAYRPLTAVVHVLDALHRLHGADLEIGGAASMIGRRDVKRQIEAGVDPDEIVRGWRAEQDAFLAGREKYLLYPRR